MLDRQCHHPALRNTAVTIWANNASNTMGADDSCKHWPWASKDRFNHSVVESAVPQPNARGHAGYVQLDG